MKELKKILRQMAFSAMFIAALAGAAAAQSDDNQNRPKKDPPVIVPPDKDKPKDRPKDDNSNKPKKPEFMGFVMIVTRRAEIA